MPWILGFIALSLAIAYYGKRKALVAAADWASTSTHIGGRMSRKRIDSLPSPQGSPVPASEVLRYLRANHHTVYYGDFLKDNPYHGVSWAQEPFSLSFDIVQFADGGFAFVAKDGRQFFERWNTIEPHHSEEAVMKAFSRVSADVYARFQRPSALVVVRTIALGVLAPRASCPERSLDSGRDRDGNFTRTHVVLMSFADEDAKIVTEWYGIGI